MEADKSSGQPYNPKGRAKYIHSEIYVVIKDVPEDVELENLTQQLNS
jgi:hypothetical protein